MNGSDKAWRKIEEIREMRKQQLLHQQERARMLKIQSDSKEFIHKEEVTEKEDNSSTPLHSSNDIPFSIHIYKPPGYWYGMLGRVFLSKKTYEEVLEETILLMQEEYFEMYSTGRTVFARWIKIRFIFQFLTILLLELPFLKTLLDIKDKLI